MFKKPGKGITAAATFLYVAISPFLLPPVDDDNEVVFAYNLKNLARFAQMEQVVTMEDGGLGLFFGDHIILQQRL